MRSTDQALPGDPALPGGPALPGDPALPGGPALPGDPAADARDGGVLGMLVQPLEPTLVRELLRSVIDPELGVNIVDLGLVYDVAVQPGGVVAIEMTLTTPGCPLGGFLDDQVRGCLAQLPQVRAVSVELVWEPPWDPEAMSDAAKEQLGWH